MDLRACDLAFGLMLITAEDMRGQNYDTHYNFLSA